MPVLEISIDSVASARAAQAGGAQRIELCSALREGGLTPSLGLLRAVRKAYSGTMFLIIRPRSGDFLYAEDEFEVMQEDIRVAAAEGVDGVVLGVLTADGDVDVARTRALVALARPMQVTFHRAFDVARDLPAALEDVIACEADRILTSGGAASAVAGMGMLQALHHQAAGRIQLLAGGGVRPGNIGELVRQTGLAEFHASLRRQARSPMQPLGRHVQISASGFDEYERTFVHADDVRELVQNAQDAATRPREASAAGA